jgi:hypothetical protein
MNTLEARSDTALKGARLVSNIFHPWAILVPVIALAAYQSANGSVEWVKWALLALVPAVVLPLAYVKIRAMSRGGLTQKISRSLVRNDPDQLFIMTALFGVPSALILYYFNGPRNLLSIILGVTAVMFVISLVNLKYRASFHLSMVTSMLTALWFLFGQISLITFLVIPVLGVSRYQMGEHTPNQMVTGFLIGLIVSSTIFYGLRLGA